ncbi:MAG: L-aspartate oxidase [Bacilli bacterium]
MFKKKTDVLILGAGLSGIYTALNINSALKVTIISKEKLGASNSSLAQGGIAGELETDEKVLAKHIEDTLKAGTDLFEGDAIKALVYEAKENIEELIKMGVPFDVDEKGQILLTKEGGHSSRRILHAGGDATGKNIMDTLKNHVLSRQNIEIIENYMAYNLIYKDNVCCGAKIISNENDYGYIFAAKTVIATGGIGAVYKDSTNSHGATGDGIAMSHRANVRIKDMEFVQFHPTVFYNVKETTPGQKFLISEAVRGEGAYLVNSEGIRFMDKYHVDKELAPRDIVSQSIYREMYDTWSECVYIDARHLDKEYLEKRFPTIYSKCLVNGLDMSKDLIPVAPVEHFGIGGIAIDLDGKTSMENLYANGECASSGVHGANRLASNSLLECIVFGKRIANSINSSKLHITELEIKEPFINTSNFSYHNVRTDVRNLMDKYVGVVRTKEGLEIALNIINKHYENIIKHPFLTYDYFRALNVITVAKLITEAALKRDQSMGCHYRVN